jgi:3-O-methylgallate 3,4-dioxygenase
MPIASPRHHPGSGANPRSTVSEKARVCQEAIASSAEELADAQPDVVLVVGDDQRELFQEDCIPAIAIFIGNEVIDTAPPRTAPEHPSMAAAHWARHGDVAESYPVDGPLARHLAATFTRQGFDIATLVKQHQRRPPGHARCESMRPWTAASSRRLPTGGPSS